MKDTHVSSEQMHFASLLLLFAVLSTAKIATERAVPIFRLGILLVLLAVSLGTWPVQAIRPPCLPR